MSRSLICIALLLIAIQAVAAQSPRTRYNFNSDWLLVVGDPPEGGSASFDDKAWKPVTTPHAWNEDDAFRRDIKDLSTGIAWYRKHFRLPADAKGQKVFIEFEGVRMAAEVYLNGKFLGRHEDGVMAFGFDLSGELLPGENVIAVRTDNSWDYKEKTTGSTFQWNDRNFYANYGGIAKNVWLHVTGHVYQTLPLYSSLKTEGTYIYATDIDIRNRTAKVNAETQVHNDTDKEQTISYQVTVRDPNGRLAGQMDGGTYTLKSGETRTISASRQVSGLNFWSWGYGYLYEVFTDLKINGKVVDSVRTRTGFRKTEFGNGLFKLNDRTIQVHGYAQRTTNEWPALGSAIPAWMSDLSNGMIVSGNGNLIRWMHVTPWKQDVESCDRVGLMESMPAGDSEKDVDGRRWDQRVELMRDAIIYNRNNPSIIFYESGNKGVSEAHMLELKAIRDKYDPHGGRASGSREMLDSKTAEYGGEMLYINKSARTPFWAMEYSRDEGLRKYWDELSPPFHNDGDGPLYNNQNAAEYNRNQDSHAVEDVVRWYDYWSARPGTGKRVSSGGVNIIFSDSNTHHRGAENYRRSGEVDALRIPKGAYFANQVMWDGWVESEKPHTHIIGHWNYAPGIRKNVYVVSNSEKVQLLINGESKGFGTRSSNFLFTFPNVSWQAGSIKAVAYDGANRVVSQDERVTAGDPVSIELTPHTSPAGFTADGEDVSIVDVEVVDKDGRRCPTALNSIDFDLSGEGEWRGGLAQGPDNHILSKTLPVEGGINRVLVRSTRRAGDVTLRASATGLKGATLKLSSKPFVSTAGLSTTIPAEFLTGRLDRGPTPSGESYSPTRLAIEPVAVKAGSNSDKASQSFDDNEVTDWSSDGKAENSWIEYDLGSAQQLDQLDLKLIGWRTRSYPLKVSVDGKVVFDGATPRSLGYVNIRFPSTTGRIVRIELTGPTNDRDGAGKIVEITGAPDPQSAANKGGLHILGIVEAEFYRSLR